MCPLPRQRLAKVSSRELTLSTSLWQKEKSEKQKKKRLRLFFFCVFRVVFAQWNHGVEKKFDLFYSVSQT